MITYVWCLSALSMRTKRIVHTYVVGVFNPSDVSRVTLVWMRGPTNNFFILLVIPVYELSNINGILSVSHEKLFSSEWLYFVVNKVDKGKKFVRHGRRRWKRVKVVPNFHIKLFTTKYNHSDDNNFSWDTDGMPFILDNSYTGITSNIKNYLSALSFLQE